MSRTRSHRPRAGRRMSRLRMPQLGSQTMRRPPRQSRAGASECLPSVISHVIPWRPLQTLNSRRCNCNVCGQSPKVTAGNYVRLLVSAGPPAAFCAAAGPASRSPPMPSGTLLWCARCGEEALFWIGTALLDSLLTYPERNNLSRLLFPIQFGGVCQPVGLLAVWQWGFARQEAPWWRVIGVSEPRVG